MYVSTLGLRSDQQTCECAAKLDVKAAFASLSAFSFPEMPRLHAKGGREEREGEKGGEEGIERVIERRIERGIERVRERERESEREKKREGRERAKERKIERGERWRVRGRERKRGGYLRGSKLRNIIETGRKRLKEI